MLFTPPRVSIWQPIEMYWAACKNEVARQWTANRNLRDTRSQLETAMTKWGDPSPLMGQEFSFCAKLVRHCVKLIRQHWADVQQADRANDQDQPIDVPNSDGSEDDSEYSDAAELEDFDEL